MHEAPMLLSWAVVIVTVLIWYVQTRVKDNRVGLIRLDIGMHLLPVGLINQEM